jgi:hypothetical protein
MALHMDIDVKEEFYSMLHNLGRDNIKRIIASDTRIAINMLIDNFKRHLASKKITYDGGSMGSMLVTALMHYMLTECMIPSERKLIIDGVKVDIVIPSSRILKSRPSNALIINILCDQIQDLSGIQPNMENVWIILPSLKYEIRGKGIDGYKMYTMDEYVNQLRGSGIDSYSISDIIDDIRSFVDSKGLRGLSIM